MSPTAMILATAAGSSSGVQWGVLIVLGVIALLGWGWQNGKKERAETDRRRAAAEAERKRLAEL